MTGTRRLVPFVARAAAAAAAAAARSAQQLETHVTRTGLGADGALERQSFSAGGALAVAVHSQPAWPSHLLIAKR